MNFTDLIAFVGNKKTNHGLCNKKRNFHIKNYFQYNL